jgi:protein TonB
VKKKGRPIIMWIYGGSLVFHLAMAAVAKSLPAEHKAESVAIELADIKKKNEKPKPQVAPPPPPPPPTEKPKPPPPPKESKAKIAAEAPKEVAPAAEPLGSDALDLGDAVSLGNGGGGGGGGGDGVAVAAPVRTAGRAAVAAAAATATTRKVAALAPPTAGQCTEPDVRPKRVNVVTPKMTRQAQLADIEGYVKVEVTVDESGNVISAHVVNGLGYGLDEEALKAAKLWTFHPATRCGKPIIGHTIIPFHFTLT